MEASEAAKQLLLMVREPVIGWEHDRLKIWPG
jgi:hypothetical protein